MLTFWLSLCHNGDSVTSPLDFVENWRLIFTYTSKSAKIAISTTSIKPTKQPNFMVLAATPAFGDYDTIQCICIHFDCLFISKVATYIYYDIEAPTITNNHHFMYNNCVHFFFRTACICSVDRDIILHVIYAPCTASFFLFSLLPEPLQGNLSLLWDHASSMHTQRPL